MSVGLPGVGLTGLFFIVSALLALPVEIVRTLGRRSSRARWAAVLRQLAIAVTMIIVLELSYLALQVALEGLSGSTGAGHASRSASIGIRLLPTGPLLITLGLILVIVCAGKLAQLLSQARRRPARAEHRISAPIVSAPTTGAVK
jgi:hypothetical protein